VRVIADVRTFKKLSLSPARLRNRPQQAFAKNPGNVSRRKNFKKIRRFIATFVFAVAPCASGRTTQKSRHALKRDGFSGIAGRFF
jgi:hypothetical protein